MIVEVGYDIPVRISLSLVLAVSLLGHTLFIIIKKLLSVLNMCILYILGKILIFHPYISYYFCCVSFFVCWLQLFQWFRVSRESSMLLGEFMNTLERLIKQFPPTDDIFRIKDVCLPSLETVQAFCCVHWSCTNV